MSTVRCLCPPTAAGEVRHPDGDTVTLRERLDLRGALTARNAVGLAQSEGDDTAGILAALTESYLFVGIESWTLVDAKGKPVPVTRDAITSILLADIDAAVIVSDEADERYAATIIPLVIRASTSSPDTPTPDSTSPTNGSPTPRKPSKRSSTTTTPTVGTATTT